nr:MAG TPA: hypothetical protein [Caudoviricetes sp.]
MQIRKYNMIILTRRNACYFYGNTCLKRGKMHSTGGKQDGK